MLAIAGGRQRRGSRARPDRARRWWSWRSAPSSVAAVGGCRRLAAAVGPPARVGRRGVRRHRGPGAGARRLRRGAGGRTATASSPPSAAGSPSAPRPAPRARPSWCFLEQAGALVSLLVWLAFGAVAGPDHASTALDLSHGALRRAQPHRGPDGAGRARLPSAPGSDRARCCSSAGSVPAGWRRWCSPCSRWRSSGRRADEAVAVIGRDRPAERPRARVHRGPAGRAVRQILRRPAPRTAMTRFRFGGTADRVKAEHGDGTSNEESRGGGEHPT